MGVLASLFGRQSDDRVVEWLGPTFQSMVLGLTAEEMYRTQPHLRIVLSFIARNIAHLGLKAYAVTAESDRTRLRKDPLALLFARPNASMTSFELLEGLASDIALYDVAYWFLAEDADAPSGWSIQPIPPSWVVEQRGGDYFTTGSYVVQNPDGRRAEIKADDLIVFRGWNPGRPKHGTSPVQALKQILAEQVQAWSYREQIWQRGGRVGAYLTRPKDAAWSPEARDRFAEAWKSRWTGMDGPKAGGTPILEDGMELRRLGLSAREEEWAEVAKVALSTVAAVYHVNPVMVGILDNANFSNTKEFRKMLYSETLGPQLARIEDRINGFLVPRVTKTEGAYVEFNIEEKLQGDFEEQAAILSTSAGAPWMTRNEVRAIRNLPAIAGGDELVVPLNVTLGGQASPRDSGTQNERAGAARSKAARVSVKQSAPATQATKVEDVVRSFFARQREAVMAKLNGAKDAAWWNGDRWDRELAADLLGVSLMVTGTVGAAAVEAAGFDPGAYDITRTEAYLAKTAAARAAAINTATREQIEAILAGDGPDAADGPGHVFDLAEGERGVSIAATLITAFAAFATVEAGKQTGAGSKTWVVTSQNPRSSHAAMNGETVPIEDNFSNGAAWPGDSSALDVDEIAGCSCDLVITYESER